MSQHKKKVLCIRDAAFLLPDDFRGNLHQAFRLFLENEVQQENIIQKQFDEEGFYTPLGIVAKIRPDGRKACYECGIVEVEVEDDQIPNLL